MNRILTPDQGGAVLYKKFQEVAAREQIPVDQVASAAINMWIDAYAVVHVTHADMVKALDEMWPKIKELAAKRYDFMGRKIGAAQPVDQIIRMGRLEG